MFARSALFLLVPLPALAEPGPVPREYHTDRHGYPLPPGAVARLGVPPALGGFPWALGWTADGRRFVTVDYGGVTVFDAATGRAIETQAIGTEGRSLYTPLTRDGRFLFLLNGRTGVLYDTATAGTHTFTLPAPFGDPDRKVYSLSLSADCRFLAGLAGSVAWRYDLARDRFTRIIPGRADLHSVRLSPDGKRAFATGGVAEPALTAHDLITHRDLWTVPLKNIGQLRAVSEDGRRLAVADRDGVRVFDAADGRPVLAAPVDSTSPPGLWGVDLSPDGTRLALAVDREVTIWESGGTVKHRLPHAARLVSFSPDGRSLLTVSAWGQRWDVRTGRPAYPAPALEKPLAASLLRWSRDGKRLLTVWPGDRRGGEPEWKPDVLAVWDVRRMDIVWRQASKEPILDAALDRAGSTVRLVREPAGYRIWPTDGSDPTDVPLKPPAARERAVDFLPDDRLLALAVVDEAVAADLYDAGGRALASRRVPFFADEQHEQYPRWPVALTRGLPGVQLRPPGRRVDLTTGRSLPPLDTRGDLFILKGQPIAGGSAVVASRIQINGPWGGPAVEGIVWDALTGGQIVRLIDRIPDWGLAALSPDGRWLAFVTGDVVEVINLARPDDRPRLRLPAADTKALAFAPDGARLATAHADGTVLVWELPARRDPWLGAHADRLWADLAATGTADAWKAQWHLLDYPDLATGLLTARVKPVPALADTAAWIAKLDHPRYAVREEAARELARHGTVVEGDLRAALRKPTSAEQRERIEGLLARLDVAVPPAGDELRALRAVWLLERIGTPGAKKVLEKLAGGAPGARVTGEAKAALNRVR